MAMASLTSFLLILLAQVDPADLTEGLKSLSPEIRARSIDALEAQGLRSLPSLRSFASESTGEPRRIAMDLIARIGATRLRRGTTVSPRIPESLVVDALKALSRDTGVSVGLWIPPDSPWRSTKISFDLTEPRTYFETIDLLGTKYGFRAGIDAPSSGMARPTSLFQLVERAGPMPPTAYAGPYRLSLVQLRRHRSVRHSPAPGEPEVAQEFHAEFEVVAEPGLVIQPNGTIRIQEAKDDLGQDLKARPKPTAGAGDTISLGDHSEQVSLFTQRLAMELPEKQGARIARLRGFLPIVALCRTDELLSTTLDDPKPRTLSGGGVTLRIDRTNMAGLVKTLDVTVLGEEFPSAVLYAAGPRQTTQASLRLPFNLADHLRIEDRNGQALATSCIPTAPPGRDGSMSYRVQIPANAPHRLRYFGVAGIATEIPFDFMDLPIP